MVEATLIPLLEEGSTSGNMNYTPSCIQAADFSGLYRLKDKGFGEEERFSRV